MSLFDRELELKTLILAATREVILQLESQNGNREIYALVFYLSSGYGDIGIAYATRSFLKKKPSGKEPMLEPEILEMMKEHPDLLQQALTHDQSEFYYEVNACEWDGIGSYFNLFSEVNNIINDEYDTLYDEGIESNEICQFFECLLTDVLIQVKSSGILNSAVFEDDVLLGVQFPDPNSTEVESVKRISSIVNSPTWHSKICDGYGI